MLKRLLRGGFICAVAVFLLAGAVRTLFLPKDMNYYENRYANKIGRPTAEACLDGTFQSSVEAALTDQVLFAQHQKKLYNDLNNQYLLSLMTPILENNPDRYINYGGLRIFGSEWITYYPVPLEAAAEEFDDRVENYNRHFSEHSGTDFFVYYIETDAAIDFETGVKNGAFEYLKERFSLPQERMARFEINSFQEYSQQFYKTDHHWDYRGSYRAYRELLPLLKIEDAPLEPMEEVKITEAFAGSKAITVGAMNFTEPFTAYRFDYPTMEVIINGIPEEDYGHQDAFFAGERTDITYGNFYGSDMGEVILSTQQPEKENILVLGESYDNAILKLLASHYNTLYSVDLRYYSNYMEKDFNLAEYLKEKDIDQVLLIGSLSFFRSSDFMLEN